MSIEVNPKFSYGFLSDFLYPASNCSIQYRIEQALKKNGGRNFWHNFFECKEIHSPCKYFFFVYTEPQLHDLWKWWNSIMTGTNPDIKNVLRNSWQNDYSTYKDGYNGSVKNVYVFYTKHNKGNHYDLHKFAFRPDKPNEKKIGGFFNFFGGAFRDKPQNNPQDAIPNNDDQIISFMRSFVMELREKMSSKHGRPHTDQKQWLFFLGRNFGFEGSVIYCCDFYGENNNECPFIENMQKTDNDELPSEETLLPSVDKTEEISEKCLP